MRRGGDGDVSRRINEVEDDLVAGGRVRVVTFKSHFLKWFYTQPEEGFGVYVSDHLVKKVFFRRLTFSEQKRLSSTGDGWFLDFLSYRNKSISSDYEKDPHATHTTLIF